MSDGNGPGPTSIQIAIGNKLIPIALAQSQLPATLRRFIILQLLDPLSARHVEPSAVASLDDSPRGPNERLLDVALRAISRARQVHLENLDGRRSAEPHWFETWPGEHYKLLAALVADLRPMTVIEIGTYTGMGCLSLLNGLPEGGTVYTFDVVPWREFELTWLREDDFSDRRLQQIIGDISDPKVMAQHAELFERADLVFVDGPKDGVAEDRFLRNFEKIRFQREPLFVFDDIRVMNMLSTWRGIDRPKLDLTSFGHWAGTGLVDWCG